MRWVIESARKRGENSMPRKLAAELLEASDADSVIAKFIAKRGEGLHHGSRQDGKIGGAESRPARARFDLGDPKQGYMTSGVPAYAAPFDFAAHVAAEWDPKIHADIERRLLEIVQPPDSPQRVISR